MYKSKRAKATNIDNKTKELVWERDNYSCIICGSSQAMPNSHFVPRSKGGLGIEQNITTMCIQCHYNYDFGDRETRTMLRNHVRGYLRMKYNDWNEDDLIYKKGV